MPVVVDDVLVVDEFVLDPDSSLSVRSHEGVGVDGFVGDDLGKLEISFGDVHLNYKYIVIMTLLLNYQK